MAKAVLPCCAASVLLHALPLVLPPLAPSCERFALRILPATSVEIALLPLAPERTGESDAVAAGAAAAEALAAPAPARAPRERLERVAARSLGATSRAAPSAPAPSAPAEATSEQSVQSVPTLAEAAPARETPQATAAVAGAPAAGAPFDAVRTLASRSSAAAAPSARTPGARDDTPGAAAQDLEAVRARYLRALRQRVLERREYPYGARRAGLQGTVCLRLSLDAAGRLSQLRATCGPSPQPLLEAALRAVRAAEPFGPLPSGLGNQLSVDLPVVFQLDAP